MTEAFYRVHLDEIFHQAHWWIHIFEKSYDIKIFQYYLLSIMYSLKLTPTTSERMLRHSIMFWEKALKVLCELHLIFWYKLLFDVMPKCQDL